MNSEEILERNIFFTILGKDQLAHKILLTLAGGRICSTNILIRKGNHGVSLEHISPLVASAYVLVLCT